MDLQDAIDSIWESTQQGIYYPPEWKDKLSKTDSYKVQLGLLARYIEAGQIQAGWKIGPTAKAIQQQLEASEPVFGFLLKEGNKPSNSQISFQDLLAPGFETELCLTIGERLQGPGVTMEMARAAISTVEPAFEIVERRGDFSADLSLAIADNVQAKYFITGSPVELTDGVDLGNTTVEIIINGELVDKAQGSNVMGNPAASVAWLANKLSEFGQKLEPGMQIMSGSLTRQFPVGQGDFIEAKFEPFGAVTAEFI